MSDDCFSIGDGNFGEVVYLFHKHITTQYCNQLTYLSKILSLNMIINTNLHQNSPLFPGRSTERKSVAIETDGYGNNSPIVTSHYDKLGTITTDVAMTTPRGAEDGVNSGSPINGSPTINTRGNTAYLPVAPRDGRDSKYVDMPSRQK